ncbi:hypothetical protein [Microbacterium sp. NPDC055683]
MSTGAARRRRTAVGALVPSMLLLAACASPLAPDSTPSESPDAAGSTGSGQAPGCDTIIPTALVDEFADIGWSSRADPFYIGPNELSGGVSCTWGNFDVGATDIVQMYGWAPLAAEDASGYQEYLGSEGWIREEGDGVVYLTESMPSSEWADENGYGMTYAFGDGWVALSDTKSGLDVITWHG